MNKKYEWCIQVERYCMYRAAASSALFPGLPFLSLTPKFDDGSSIEHRALHHDVIIICSPWYHYVLQILTCSYFV